VTNEIAVLRRLWIEPALAPHFSLQGFWIGTLQLLVGGTTSGPPLPAGEGVPAMLFERRYGSPLWEEIVEASTQVSVTVANRSGHPRTFHGVVLGCSLELALKVARGA